MSRPYTRATPNSGRSWTDSSKTCPKDRLAGEYGRVSLSILPGQSPCRREEGVDILFTHAGFFQDLFRGGIAVNDFTGAIYLDDRVRVQLWNEARCLARSSTFLCSVMSIPTARISATRPSSSKIGLLVHAIQTRWPSRRTFSLILFT